jgi:hypothetical protein
VDDPPRYAPIEIYELFVTHLPGKAGTKYAVRRIEIERAGHVTLITPCLPETELDFLDPILAASFDRAIFVVFRSARKSQKPPPRKSREDRAPGDLPLDLKPDFQPDLELLDLAVFNPAALFRDLNHSM